MQSNAQSGNCTFKPAQVAIRFESGNVADINSKSLFNYQRVPGYCPTDGHYAYSAFTSECFRDDWHTVSEDHTAGDADGNMMLVNASPGSGTFFITQVEGLKSGTTYEFALWLMNLCKITEKCPFPLLPDIMIRLQTKTGRVIATLSTGELQRHDVPHWTPYRALFTMPASETALVIHMMDNNPGGCGNDFALDDITFRECVKTKPVVRNKPATTAPKPAANTGPKAATGSKPSPPRPKPTVQKKSTAPVKKKLTPARPSPIGKDSAIVITPPAIRRTAPPLPPPPPILRNRTNVLIKRIETAPGEIRLDLYDNGEIDNDTVSIYHNNRLMVSRARLSAAPITFRIAVDELHPHHELVMVANNLGSIPPNTSLMIVTAGDYRVEVFISSTQQKNAKVILDLKK